MTKALNLEPMLQRAFDLAAGGHDFGKVDPCWQAAIGNDDRKNPLAKSFGKGFNARMLNGYRHEFGSLLDVAAEAGPDEPPRRDVTLHLIASHHGRCRPFAPVVDDPNPVVVTHDLGGSPCVASSRHGLESFGSGTSERFWVLVRRYGWFGLAYLEALLRLADQRVSEEEQTAHTRREAGAHA